MLAVQIILLVIVALTLQITFYFNAPVQLYSTEIPIIFVKVNKKLIYII